YNAFERKRTFLSACFGSLSFIHHKEEKFTMKLKKIASLALAGVMAVSMLAGCSTTSVEPTPNPDEDNTQVSGYSQMLYNQLGYSAKKKVTAEDSSAVNQALETAMGYAAGNTIANSYDWFINGDTNVVNADWTEPVIAVRNGIASGIRSEE